MSETRNIVVLGASCAGLSAAHYIAKHTLPKLRQAKDGGAPYELHLVDQSTHFWWHISAPRAIVSVDEIPHDKAFIPIMDGFKQYPALKDAIHFHHAAASALDPEARTVTLRPSGSGSGSDSASTGTESLPYYALIIATGIRSPTPLTTLQGEHTLTVKALDDMNARLAQAKDVLIAGGGPVGVETAGEIGAHLQRRGGGATVTLVTSGDKLLPVLRKALSQKAQKQLEKLGVRVVYGAKVTGTQGAADGRTEVTLSAGEPRTVDVFIPAGGVRPNAEFVPAALRRADGYVATNGATLRVDGAGPRVYAVGDVAGVDKGGVLNLFAAVPVWAANFNHDVLGEAKLGADVPAEKAYKRKDGETQIVPVGAKMGVGAFNGFKIPGFVVAAAKGKNYMIGSMGDFTEGKKWTKA